LHPAWAQIIRIEASPSSRPILTTSVAVVRKMLEAVAGSVPKRLSVSGTMAPEMPLMVQAPTIARKTTIASTGACGECCELADQAAILEALRRGTAYVHGCGRVLVHGSSGEEVALRGDVLG